MDPLWIPREEGLSMRSKPHVDGSRQFEGTRRDSKTRKPEKERTTRYSTGAVGTSIRGFDSRWRYHETLDRGNRVGLPSLAGVAASLVKPRASSQPIMTCA